LSHCAAARETLGEMVSLGTGTKKMPNSRDREPVQQWPLVPRLVAAKISNFCRARSTQSRANSFYPVADTGNIFTLAFNESLGNDTRRAEMTPFWCRGRMCDLTALSARLDRAVPRAAVLSARRDRSRAGGDFTGTARTRRASGQRVRSREGREAHGAGACLAALL